MCFRYSHGHTKSDEYVNGIHLEDALIQTILQYKLYLFLSLFTGKSLSVSIGPWFAMAHKCSLKLSVSLRSVSQNWSFAAWM